MLNKRKAIKRMKTAKRHILKALDIFEESVYRATGNMRDQINSMIENERESVIDCNRVIISLMED